MRWTAFVALTLAVLAAPAAAEPAWRPVADSRFGYYALDSEARDGSDSYTDEYRIRLRLGLEADPAPAWQARLRLAGRYGHEQDRTRFYLQGNAPTPSGLEQGDSTIDEAYLRYAPAHGRWWLRAGRFQSKFELQGVAAKSLDRNDSPNVDIAWTDGAHLAYELSPSWRGHLLLQYNGRRGPGSTVRPPLAFDRSGSRVALFAALEGTRPWGAVQQRMLALTVLPNALAPHGRADPQRQDYLAVTAKAAAEWPLGESGTRFGLSGELGYAPNTPDAAVNAGDSGAGGGVAGQISANLYDLFAAGHGLALVYGRAEAGWLISPDFRANDELLELRYQWRFHPDWSLETRLRSRREIDVPAAAGRAREDRDFYIRITARFF